MKRFAWLTLLLAGPLCAPAAPAAPAAGPNDEALSAQALLALATDPVHPATTVSDLVARLPESYRANFVLIYDSRSLQSSTPDAPRVIMYGADASFLVAFNGDPSESHYDQLEIMQQNPQTKDFELYALTFPKDGGQDGAPTLSEKNPALCLSCHRPDPRPNWEPYPVWPGVYGSVHNGTPTSAIDETTALARFVAGPGKTGRYAQLVGLAQRYTPTDDRPVSSNNDDFTTILAQRNMDRIVARLMASPDYARYKYAILGAVAEDCGDATKDLPAAVQATLGSIDPVRTRAEAADARLQAQQQRFSSDASFFSEAGPQAALRYLVEPRGIDTSTWSMSLDSQIQSLGTGQFGIYDINQAFYRADPDLRPYLEADDPIFGHHCDDLAAKSLQVLSAPR